MIEAKLHLWLWCEHCLEWKDTDDLLMAKEIDEYGKDLFTFTCDACKRDTIGSMVVSARAKPKGSSNGLRWSGSRDKCRIGWWKTWPLG